MAIIKLDPAYIRLWDSTDAFAFAEDKKVAKELFAGSAADDDFHRSLLFPNEAEQLAFYYHNVGNDGFGGFKKMLIQIKYKGEWVTSWGHVAIHKGDRLSNHANEDDLIVASCPIFRDDTDDYPLDTKSVKDKLDHITANAYGSLAAIEDELDRIAGVTNS